MSRSKGIHAEAVVSSVTVDLTAIEHDLVAVMRAKIHQTSDANVVRIALWNLAKHLELKPGIDVFACRINPAQRKEPA